MLWALSTLGWATDSFWTNSANWNPNAVPGAADNANFSSSPSYTVTFSSGATNANAFLTTATVPSRSQHRWHYVVGQHTSIIGQNAGRTSTVTQTSGTIGVTKSISRSSAGAKAEPPMSKAIWI